jgi:amino acid permease
MEVTRAMKLLYRYNAVGQADSVRQLNRMITTTGKWLRQQRISDQGSQSALFQWWGILPLLSVTIVFLVMMMVTITSFMERGETMKAFFEEYGLVLVVTVIALGMITFSETFKVTLTDTLNTQWQRMVDLAD